MHKVTIMIPTYNQAQYLEKCVNSAIEQDYHNLEVVISDDSSSDETKKIINDLYGHNHRVKYFQNKSRLGRVRNYRDTLYKKATGDYALNLDGDDWLINKTYISNAVKILDEHPDVVCVMARIKYYHAHKNKLENGAGYDKVNPIMEGTEYLMLNARKQLPFNHLTGLYRRNKAKEMDFYTVDTVWTDSQSLFRLIFTGSIAFIDEYVGVWRIHNANESKQFFENIPIDELFLSEQSAADFFSTNAQGKDFNSSHWLAIWKYEHVKECIIYFLKTKNYHKLRILIVYLVKKQLLFFVKITPKLLFDVSQRFFSFLQRL